MTVRGGVVPVDEGGPRTIAFVGLGNMGRGMASRLLEAGHRLRVYNRTSARADALVRRGATRYDCPKDACEGVDAVISMVADDPASRAVWLDHDGILGASLAERGFAIECSTLSHDWVTELVTRCRARGLRYIDAPVTGLPAAAAAGELTLLVGAATDDLEAARAFLDAVAHRILRFGDVGSGTAGPQVVRNVRRMAADDHEHDIVFSGALRLKDVEYGVRFARTLNMGSPFGALAENVYRQLCSMGYAHVNESKVIEVSRRATMDATAELPRTPGMTPLGY